MKPPSCQIYRSDLPSAIRWAGILLVLLTIAGTGMAMHGIGLSHTQCSWTSKTETHSDSSLLTRLSGANESVTFQTCVVIRPFDWDGHQAYLRIAGIDGPALTGLLCVRYVPVSNDTDSEYVTSVRALMADGVISKQTRVRGIYTSTERLDSAQPCGVLAQTATIVGIADAKKSVVLIPYFDRAGIPTIQLPVRRDL